MFVLVAGSSCVGRDQSEEPKSDTGVTETPAASTRATTTASAPPLELGEEALLRVGMEGPEVRSLQVALSALGFDTGATDGLFGPATKRAVMDFQRTHRVNADGVVGAETIEAINEALSLTGVGGDG